MVNRLQVCFTVICMVVVVLCWSHPTLAAEMAEVDTQNSLNVRAEPSEQATIIGSLAPGEQIEFIELGNGWGQITFDGELGFVSTAYLLKQERTQQPESKPTEPNMDLPQIQRVVIDAGHGGKDPGAIGYDLYEKTVALSISQQVKSMLEHKGIEVMMTRGEDLFVSLENRVAISNHSSADLFVSIHANGYSNPSANGVETFYYEGSHQGKQIAQMIQQELAEKTANRNRGVFASDFYVLKHTDMPAVLVEAGFVSNEKDASLLKTQEYQQKVAEAISTGIDNLS